MNKYCVAFIFFFYSFCSFCQTDTIQRYGTLKIGRAKPDSIYIKAGVVFFQFQDGYKKDGPHYSPSDAIPPQPGNTKAPFDYSRFFNARVRIKVSDLESKTSDTVRIQVKILENGKAYFKDMTPLLVLNGVPAYYDSKNNGYMLDAIHWKCLNALKEIESWEPGYILMEKVAKFKGQTVIKAKKKKLTSTGIVTVIFSLVPFEEPRSN